MELLYEASVSYTRCKIQAAELGLRHYLYTWIHIATGKRGTNFVFVLGGDREYLKLLNHWNLDEDWKFLGIGV